MLTTGGGHGQAAPWYKPAALAFIIEVRGGYSHLSVPWKLELTPSIYGQMMMGHKV